MDAAVIQSLLQWIAAHPGWAGLVVFMIAFFESLAAVGLLMPGALLMFGVGALIATGSLAFWPTVAWAVAGAIAGDAVSFAIGRYYKDRLRGIWPFRRHPALLERGIVFFQRHGGKSILLGRFVGPIRPIIPAVAGMLDMPAWRFEAVNVASALAWAPAYLLPGVAFGASLELAAEVASRLAIFLVLTLALLWFTAWLLRRIYGWLAPRSDAMIYQALLWSKAHPVLGQLPASVLQPGRHEARGLTLLALLLVLSTLGFLWFSRALSDNPLLGNLDQFVFHALQDLRTPWADALMAALTGMGDPTVLAVVIALLACWLGVRRYREALVHWLAATLVPYGMVFVLQFATRGDRAPPLDFGSYAFPSAHATLATAVYGFMAVLVARELRLRWRPIAYSLVGLGISAIAFSRLYLGAHWLSDVLGGMALGLAWVALIGIAYRRHLPHELPVNRLLPVMVGILFAAIATNGMARLADNLDTFGPRFDTRDIEGTVWWAHGWQTAPAYRNDLRGRHRHPLTVQWAGPLARIQGSLEDAGWKIPERGALSALEWLRPAAEVERIPVLPQVHAGHHEALLMVKGDTAERITVLRLWPADLSLHFGAVNLPLWLGNVSVLAVDHPLGLSVLRTAEAFDAPRELMATDLGTDPTWALRAETRAGVDDEHWDGDLLLIRPSGPLGRGD